MSAFVLATFCYLVKVGRPELCVTEPIMVPTRCMLWTDDYVDDWHARHPLFRNWRLANRICLRGAYRALGEK